MGSKWGIGAEVTFRKGIEEILKDFGGDVTKWFRRINWIGDNGLKKEKKYEIDIIIKNGKRMLVEVKSTCLLEHVERFIEVCDIYKELEKVIEENIEKIIVCIYIDEDAQNLAIQNGIRIIKEN